MGPPSEAQFRCDRLQEVELIKQFSIKCGAEEICTIDMCMLCKTKGVVKLRIFGEIDGTKHLHLANNKDSAAMLAAFKFCEDRGEACVFIRSRHAVCAGASDERVRDDAQSHFVRPRSCVDRQALHCVGFAVCR